MKCIAFILGAGSSIPAGYSSTDCLTKLIRAPSGYFRHTDERYIAGDIHPTLDLVTPVVRRIVGWLFKKTQEYFIEKDWDCSEINYEDLYHLSSQLADERSEAENPALRPFAKELNCEMSKWPEYQQVFGKGKGVLDFCHETCRYIEDIVADILSRSAVCVQHLELIEAVHKAEGMDLKGVGTLAHDTHVETHLRSKDINLADGFSAHATECGWRVWDDWFPAGLVPYMKLHGSVDWKYLWWRRRDRDGYVSVPDPDEDTVGIGDCAERRPQGTGYRHEIRRPRLLIGTFNKPSGYAQGMMLDIHYRFRKILKESNTLVVCGYSFRDKAINSHILLSRRPGQSLIVIDPQCQEQIINTARNAVRRILNSETTHFISRPLECICPNRFVNRLVKI